MSKKLAIGLAMLLALLPLAANALGLGEIKLQSALNQPLNAEIAVVGAAPDEIASLHVKVANPGQFQQAGIPMAAVLNQLKFEVVPGANGTASVHITTTQPFREPFLDVLLDATWDNGELIREYTVFLNPPNFEVAAKPAAAAAVAATPAPPAGTATAASAPPAASSALAPAPPAAPAAALPPSSPAVAPAPLASASGTPQNNNYGPIQRGETLTEIALKVRPQGVTLNQMMIAIYRANPTVFIHNINLMKAGLVLRIPSADDIQAVSVADANSEVRTQINAWRATRAVAAAPATPAPSAPVEKPALTLVAPSAAEKNTASELPGAGAGGAALAPGHAAGGATGAGKTAPASATTAGRAPIKVASAGLAAVQSEAAKQSHVPGVTTKVTPLKIEQPGASKPLPKRKVTPPVTTQPVESGGFVGTPIFWLIIALIIIVIALIVLRVLRKRHGDAAPSGGGSGRKSPSGKPGKVPPAETEKWDAQESASSDSTPPASAAAGRIAAPAVAVAAAGAGAVAAGASATKQESDPVAESDFHMAYGLYDQAADVLKKGLAQNPGRRDLKLKLLEVYFTAGDRENFLETARSLRHDMGATPDKDWDKVAIMGHQIAADDALFSGDGAATAAPAVSVDIPLESTVSGEVAVPEVDPLAGAFTEVQPPTAVEAAAASATQTKEDSHVIDFELPDIEPLAAKTGTGTATIEATPAKAGKPVGVSTATVNADFGTDSQVEFDKALKELSDFVNTNVPVQEETAAAAPAAAGAAALSLSADDPLAADVATGTRSATGTGGETTGLNEIGTKLDLARAYIDMGDSEGAKNILREVLEEGDREQTEEAKKLMQKLP